MTHGQGTGRSGTTELPELEFHPVTADRLGDLARFARTHGRFRYCSCMRWRMTSSEFARSPPTARAARLVRMVRDGNPVGVLAYANGVPIGWCSVAPRETYAALARYKKLAPIDDRPVWAIACFFVDARFRRRGVPVALLEAAVAYAFSHGAHRVEGYPVEPGRLYGFMGTLPTFERVGFRDATPPGRERRVLRLESPTTSA